MGCSWRSFTTSTKRRKKMKSMNARVSLIVCTLLFSFCMTMPALAVSDDSGKPASQDIRLLAKQMDAPNISEAQKKNVSTRLMSLNRDEVLSLKKLWRAELVAKGVVSQSESAGFAIIEQIEMIFSKKIAELFGEDATIFNISSEDFVSVELALSTDAVLRELVQSAEDAFKAETSDVSAQMPSSLLLPLPAIMITTGRNGCRQLAIPEQRIRAEALAA